MLEVARFYEDFFVEGSDGFLVSMPSQSPENCPNGEFEGAGCLRVCVNATMDFAIARELFGNLIEVSERLGVNQDSLQRWKAFAAKIPPYRINDDGAIAEWMDDRLEDNYHHRHLSHLYPVFPGREICRIEQPKLFEACRKAVEKRLDVGIEQQTGWSLAHMALSYARLGEGDRALASLRLLTRSCLGKNFFTYHNSDLEMGITQPLIKNLPAPFQIDANFGITAAVLEMLVFSRPGFIHLLPALPSSWTEGFICGVCCMGGVEVDLRWSQEENEIEVKVSSGTEVEIEVVFGCGMQQELLCIQVGTPLVVCKEWNRLKESKFNGSR